MSDRSRHADDEQWFGLLEGLEKQIRLLRERSVVVRGRTRGDTIGFPSASPGFAERGASHAPRIDREGNVIEPDPDDLPPAHSDLTGELATALADGHRRPDELTMLRREGERWAARALGAIEKSVGCFSEAIPGALADPVREQCASCWTPKDIVTKYGEKPKEWVPSAGKCASCVRRESRHPVSDKKPSQRSA